MIKQVKLKNLKLKNRIFLAPMHQVNDMAFRMLAKKAGASLTYTGLLNPQTKEKLFFQDKPAVQFACNNIQGIIDFIKKHDKKISLYDFNLGCPSPHAKQSKIGYFMINNIKAIKEILKTIRQTQKEIKSKNPLTIKIRKMPEQDLIPILKLAEKYCDAISIHPRTQSQGYSGIPDISFAKQVKKMTKLPLIYSGNIQTKQEAQQMLNEFDFIMIGRASIGNPSIFSDILEKKIKRRINFWDWLKLSKKLNRNLYTSQIKFQAINFTRGFEGAPNIRNKLSLAKTENEIIKIMQAI
jgi:tRNA-dihydrouridine synthase